MSLSQASKTALPCPSHGDARNARSQALFLYPSAFQHLARSWINISLAEASHRTRVNSRSCEYPPAPPLRSTIMFTERERRSAGVHQLVHADQITIISQHCRSLLNSLVLQLIGSSLSIFKIPYLPTRQWKFTGVQGCACMNVCVSKCLVCSSMRLKDNLFIRFYWSETR